MNQIYNKSAEFVLLSSRISMHTGLCKFMKDNKLDQKIILMMIQKILCTKPLVGMYLQN